MPPIIRFIACRYAGKVRTEPDCIVTYETALDMVEARVAEWSKGAKYLILRKTEAEMAPAAMSCKMGPEVIEGCADGEERFTVLRDAWRGRAA